MSAHLPYDGTRPKDKNAFAGMPAGGSLGAGDEREKPPRAVLYPGGLFSERCGVEVAGGLDPGRV